jgi:tRNA(fMet)-specific endonuclease VapC
MMFVLDTDHVSLFQRRHPVVVEKLQLIPASQLAVTIVTYEEQVRGWLKVVSRSADDPRKLIFGYKKLNESLDFFSNQRVLDFTEIAFDQFQELTRQKVRVGTQDLRIASIALSIDATVVTRNRRDFERVPGLKIEDWSIVLDI